MCLTSGKFLYSALISKVGKEKLKNIVDGFLLNLNLDLQAENSPGEVRRRVMRKYTDIGIKAVTSCFPC